MIAGCILLSLVGAANVQAAEGEPYVTVAQADGNVNLASVDRANDLLNVMPKKLLDGFLDNGWTFYQLRQSTTSIGYNPVIPHGRG